VPDVLVPPARLPRWTSNFEERHGIANLAAGDGALRGVAPDGSTFVATAPFGRVYDGPASITDFLSACEPPEDWGILLVRKGGFGIARMRGEQMGESKTGQRHVQGRTKAGGQSQQRFARRRDNQARVAYEAAAEHAQRLLTGVPVLVVGGDRTAIDQVLDVLGRVVPEPVGPFITVPDPRRSVLESAVATACSVRIEVDNA
jgi:hypothetical protein